MTATAWTDERIGRLKTLWLEGRTAEFISRDLGCGVSRSAVLGKVHRLGLSAGRVAQTPKTSGARPKPKTKPKPKGASPTSQARPDAALPASGTPPLGRGCGARTILSVRRSDCRWPFGDPLRPGFSLCGCPVTRGAFCAEHAAIAYRPRPETSQGLDRLAGLT